MTRGQYEAWESFKMYQQGGLEMYMVTNIKKWEFVLYGGKRPEFYPEDRKAIFALLLILAEKQQREEQLKQQQQ
jgi:hypothetical protein